LQNLAYFATALYLNYSIDFFCNTNKLYIGKQLLVPRVMGLHWTVGVTLNSVQSNPKSMLDDTQYHKKIMYKIICVRGYKMSTFP